MITKVIGFLFKILKFKQITVTHLDNFGDVYNSIFKTTEDRRVTFYFGRVQTEQKRVADNVEEAEELCRLGRYHTEQFGPLNSRQQW